MIRADFTVKGANVSALIAEANRTVVQLAGDTHTGDIDRYHVEVDSRTEPNGTVVLWRAEVQCHLYPKPGPNDEEPF